MATRREIQQRRAKLREAILGDCRSGTLAPGDMLPPLHELSKDYGLSVPLVARVVQALAEEKIVYAVPGAGTFVGRPRPSEAAPCLMISPYAAQQGTPLAAVQIGFEDRIAQLGGRCMALGIETARQWRQSGDLPEIAGLFAFDVPEYASLWDAAVPQVEFGELAPDKPQTDMVSFDNAEGGRQAAQHLLSLGHRRIAFLALHGTHDEAGEFRWSGEREDGWREALRQVGESTAGLAFHPPRTAQIAFEEQTAAARLAAEALAQRRDISAVVAVNQPAMRGLFQALRAAEIPEALWPAVVGFDGISVDVADHSAAAHVVTALRLPWELIGQSAAELLWERQQGRLSGAAQQRWVRMRLIPRLTSQHDWSHAAGTPGLAAIVQSVG